jgi:hypothetical protein
MEASTTPIISQFSQGSRKRAETKEMDSEE